MKRRRTKKVKIGNFAIGRNVPISVQSMTKVDPHNLKAILKQIRELQEAGCEIVRVAVPDKESAENLGVIKKKINIPLMADIHFHYRLALEAIKQGVDGLRLNPGNVKKKGEIEEVVASAKKAKIPIRIGVNIGSLKIEKGKTSNPLSQSRAMVKAALKYIKIFEKLNFYDIILSLKSSDVPATIKAYQLMAEKCDYPFHLGITEAGLPFPGSIKSAVGLGTLLTQGMGDTIRVSLTAPPVEEVKVGYEILKSLGLRQRGPTIISCPTCGRCEIDLVKIVQEVEKGLNQLTTYDLRLTTDLPLTTLKIALMGCIVNGPGEARDADIGIAGGKGMGLLFKYGKPIRKVKEKDLVKTLLTEIKKMI
jgi:(E)-4-hydroxy-3-methylbut-2-enyl-diphosphate synthase